MLKFHVLGVITLKTLNLYSTPGCHLCEQAAELLWPIMTNLNLTFTEIDIAHSEVLVERFGVRIPVLSYEGRELNWPFTAEEVLVFCQ